MDMKRKQPIMSVGIISLGTFLTVLVFTIFSVLILSSARTDTVMSERTALTISQYYTADAEAEERFADLYDIYMSTEGAEMKAALEALGCVVTESEEYDGMIAEYSVVIDEARNLLVRVGLPTSAEGGEKGEPERLAWKTKIDEIVILE